MTTGAHSVTLLARCVTCCGSLTPDSAEAHPLAADGPPRKGQALAGQGTARQRVHGQYASDDALATPGIQHRMCPGAAVQGSGPPPASYRRSPVRWAAEAWAMTNVPRGLASNSGWTPGAVHSTGGYPGWRELSAPPSKGNRQVEGKARELATEARQGGGPGAGSPWGSRDEHARSAYYRGFLRHARNVSAYVVLCRPMA